MSRVVIKLQQGVRHLFSGRYLWLTNTITMGGLMAVGDSIEQGIEKFRGVHHEYDWRRTGNMSVVGAGLGPFLHVWYTMLDKKLPQATLKAVGKKVLADQFVGAPLMAFAFFMGMAKVSGESTEDGWKEFKKKFAMVYLFDWIIWPPAQFVNFMWVPNRYRVLYVSAASVIYDVFLSYIKYYDAEESTDDEKKKTISKLE